MLSCGGKNIISFLLRLPESVEKAVYTVGRLIFEDFDAAFHLWTRNDCQASEQAMEWDHGANMTVLTSILDDLANAPTGWT